jgi:ABC-type branched-subunit amino acid transport system ATPase component
VTAGPWGLAPILVSRVIAKIKELKERKRLTVLMAEQNAPIKRYYLGA